MFIHQQCGQHCKQAKKKYNNNDYENTNKGITNISQ